MCMMRLGLGLEGMIAAHVKDITEALCDMEDCTPTCSTDWEGSFITCSQEQTEYRKMLRALIERNMATQSVTASITAAKMSAPPAAREELEKAEARAKAMEEASNTSAEVDDQPNDADPSVEALKACQSGPSGGVWARKDLERIVATSVGRDDGRASKTQVKTWLKDYCSARTASEGYACVGLLTNVKGELVEKKKKLSGGCDLWEWIAARAKDEWTELCPWNRWRLCEAGERCQGKGTASTNIASCFAKELD
ncbi:unnamed protein product [Effrenium voratum]|nr:unnamed protein product [Effrenium voratum]